MTWSPSKRVSEILPCRTFAQAGLRWCGGWRRANLRGSHDKAEIPSKGPVPLNRPNEPQIRIPQRPQLDSSKPPARSNTKHARIIDMLRTPAGATIAAIMAATEWQQHSVRGFLAGVVRKKLGLNLVSEVTDKGRVYRIKDGKASIAAGDRVKQAA